MLNIGYCRCARCGRFIVTLLYDGKRQQIVVSPAHFYRILPAASRRTVADYIAISGAQARALGFSTWSLYTGPIRRKGGDRRRETRQNAN